MYRLPSPAERMAFLQPILRCGRRSFSQEQAFSRGLDLGDIDVRSIAPTLAKFLGFPFPTADLPPLNVLTARAK
jgi:hypothetical protein